MGYQKVLDIEKPNLKLCLVNLAHLDPPNNGGLSRVAQHVSQLLLHCAQTNRRFIPIYIVNADFVDQFAEWIGSSEAITIPYDLYAPPLAAFSKLKPDWIVGPLFGVKPLQLFPEFDGVPQIVVMPDTLALDKPKVFRKTRPSVLREDYQLLKKVDRIITLSEFSRERLISHLNLKPGHVSAIGLGADGFSEPASISNQGGVLPRPYVFYPANSWPHKRHELLFKIMDRIWIRRPDMHLILTGKHSADLGVDISRLMKHYKMPVDRVHDLQFVSDFKIGELYTHAEALLFVSGYEGFGMPVVEAMLQSCPVICAPVTSIPEVAGNAALYVDSDNPELWASALLDELPAQRRMLVERGLERAKRFTWANMRQRWADTLITAGLPLSNTPENQAMMSSYASAEAELRQLTLPAADPAHQNDPATSYGLLQYFRYLLKRGISSRSGKLPDISRVLHTVVRLLARRRIW